MRQRIPSPREEKSVLSKREFLKSVLAWGAFVSVSCKQARSTKELKNPIEPLSPEKDSTPISRNALKSDEPQDGQKENIEKKGNESKKSKPVQPQQDIRPVTRPTAEGKPCPIFSFDADKLQTAEESLSVRTIFYGRAHQSLFALSLPKYQHGTLKGFFLINDQNTIIFYKKIESARDIEAYQLRPQVQVGLALPLLKKMRVVFETDKLSISPSFVLRPTDFFRNKSCVGFEEGVILPAPQNLPTLGPEWIITDIMGQEIEKKENTSWKKKWVILYQDRGTHYAQHFVYLP